MKRLRLAIINQLIALMRVVDLEEKFTIEEMKEMYEPLYGNPSLMAICATEKGHTHILKYLVKERGYIPTEELIEIASKRYKTNTLTYLISIRKSKN